MTTVTFTSSHLATEKITTDRLLWAGVLTTVLTVATNLAIYFNAESRIDLSGFPLLNPASVIGMNAAAAVLATIIYGLLGRYASHPTATFQRISLITLVLSYVPILALLFVVLPGAVITAGTILTLALMHTVAAATIVGMLTTVARQMGWEHTGSPS